MRPLMLLRNLAKILAMDPCVVSDTHFFHDRIFSEFEPVRQTFAPSRAEFDDKMIEVLRRSSPLLHLGDVTIDSRNPAVMNERIEWVTRRLRAVPKILLPGNHDRNSLFLYEKGGWKVVPCGVDLTGSPPRFYPDAPPFLLWNIDGRRVFFSHEPVLFTKHIIVTHLWPIGPYDQLNIMRSVDMCEPQVHRWLLSVHRHVFGPH